MGIMPASLAISGETYNPIGNTGDELTFALPKHYFGSTAQKVGFKSLQLSTSYKTGGFLGIGEKITSINYNLVVYVLPNRIGTYLLNVVKKGQRQDRQPVNTQTVRVMANGSTSDRGECVEIHVDTGWLIDTNTIAWKLHHADTAEFHGFRNVSTSGFCIDLLARGKGPFNGRGSISGNASYIKYRMIDTEEELKPVTDNLEWGKSAEHPLPTDLIRFTLEVDSYDGQRYIANGTKHWEILKVDFDGATKQLIIRPATVDQAVVTSGS